jgi:hypothetical protein
MIVLNTNLLLTLSVSIVTNFTQLVGITDYRPPLAPAELHRRLIGDGLSAISVRFEDQNGYKFSVRDGVVWRFSSPSSLENWSTPSRVESLLGEAKLSTNDAVRIATETVTRLAKGWNPISGTIPSVATPRRINGKQPPFYWISWPTTNTFPLIRWSAFVEVDARTGRISSLELKDPGFNDYASTLEISNRVCSVEVVPNASSHINPRPQVLLPVPTKDQIRQGMKSWLWLCEQLRLNPGDNTNLASVDWRQTITYTDSVMFAMCPIIQVLFTNGAGFSSRQGVAISHVSADSCFASAWGNRSQEQWKAFSGRINWNWKEISSRLETLISDKLRISHEVFTTFVPNPDRKPPSVGTDGVKRLVIEWRKWPRSNGSVIRVDDTKLGFNAEVDLESGKLVWIFFYDPIFLRALASAQHL